ncbi:hypothetical protein [Absidia glauca]|uniref:Uncharacterized protein n=1 Tax=Absidia glauca TaxID=4829 RepID=A0A168MG83_ABSGL|nr:hypothetical protein [Absidia glauca]
MFSVIPVPKPYTKCMSVMSRCQGANVCCHSVESTKKKGATMQKVNVSHGKTKMDKTVRRRQVIRGEVPCQWKEKSDQKRRRSKEKGFDGNAILCGQNRSLQISRAAFYFGQLRWTCPLAPLDDINSALN